MRGTIVAISLPALALALVGQTDRPPAPAVVSVWYRGSPAGTPRQQDLAAIRLRGFAGVTWPSRQTAGQADLHRMAAGLGLQVTLRIDPVPLTAASARAPGTVVDIMTGRVRPEAFQALVWRAVAHGAGIVSFDPGMKSGNAVEDDARRARPWVEPALAVARQLTNHAGLIAEWRPTGRVALDAPAPDAVDLQLLEDERSRILVVTNTSRARVRAVARLPGGVPAALWVNLLDGSLLSMIAEPAGARWNLDLEAGAARVYVVNK